MAITPTVLGTGTVKGEPVLIVAAGENAEGLKFVNVPIGETSPEAIQVAFVTACIQLGYGQPGGAGDHIHAQAELLNAGQEQQALTSEGEQPPAEQTEHHD